MRAITSLQKEYRVRRLIVGFQGPSKALRVVIIETRLVSDCSLRLVSDVVGRRIDFGNHK